MQNICGTGSKTSKSLYNHKWKYHRNTSVIVDGQEQPVIRRSSSHSNNFSEPRVETSIEEADAKAEALIARIGDMLYCGDCGKSMPKEKKWQVGDSFDIQPKRHILHFADIIQLNASF